MNAGQAPHQAAAFGAFVHCSFVSDELGCVSGGSGGIMCIQILNSNCNPRLNVRENKAARASCFRHVGTSSDVGTIISPHYPVRGGEGKGLGASAARTVSGSPLVLQCRQVKRKASTIESAHSNAAEPLAIRKLR